MLLARILSKNPPTRRMIHGKTSFTVDANVSYRRKPTWFGRALDWSCQLNVKNDLDDDDLFITAAFTDGAPRQYTLLATREWMLTNTVRF